MSSARRNLRNLIANWSSQVISLAVFFFLSPFVIHSLGPFQYGIWSLVTVLTGHLGLLDLGVRASTGRHVILYLGKGEHKTVDHTIRTSLGFFSITSGFVLLAGVLIGWLFPSVFTKVPPESHWLVQILLPVMAINVWFSAINAAFASVLQAHERFEIIRGVEIFSLAIRTAGTVVALNMGYGLAGLAFVVVVANVFTLIADYAMARKIYPRLRAWPPMLSKPRVRELMGYGVAAFIANAATKIIGQTDLIIVGAAISVAQDTVYSVGAMLIYYSGNFISPIQATFFPSLQRAAARGEMGPLRWIYLRQIRLGMIVGILLYVGFMVFSEPFIRLWMFHPDKFPMESVRNAATVMCILAASKLLLLPEGGITGLLSAVGRVHVLAKITLVEAATNLGLSLFFVLVLKWGLAGVAAGTFFARLLVRTFVMPVLACQSARLKLSSFALKIGGLSLAGGGIFALACLGLRELIGTESWAKFGIAAGASLVAYLPIALFILAPTQDRKRLFQKLRRGREVEADQVICDGTRNQ